MTKLREIIRKEINQLLEAKEPFKDYNDIKSWAGKNKNKVLHKIRFDAIKQNYPNLTQSQMEDYGSMLQYPYHSTFSLYDLKSYFKKLSNSQKGKKITESIPSDRSKKVADIFNNKSGFRYYAGQNDASIVAPSTNNRKWYGQIIDILDKANIGKYSLNASQKPGYFILTFE